MAVGEKNKKKEMTFRELLTQVLKEEEEGKLDRGSALLLTRVVLDMMGQEFDKVKEEILLKAQKRIEKMPQDPSLGFLNLVVIVTSAVSSKEFHDPYKKAIQYLEALK